MTPSATGSVVPRWRRLFGGLVAFCLLMPVPFAAAIDYTTSNWSIAQNDFLFQGGTTFSSTPGVGIELSKQASQAVFTFNIPAGGVDVSNGGKTIINGTIPTSNEVINAHWTNLPALQITAGSMIISITFNTSNNMFAPTTFPPNATSDPPITSTPALTGSIPIQITFDYSGGAVVGNPTDPATAFRLTFD
jgi:hypothetical protein